VRQSLARTFVPIALERRCEQNHAQATAAAATTTTTTETETKTTKTTESALV